MTRITLELSVAKDQCLGKTVYRGSIAARELVPTCWIDFHDIDRNRFGYQRPFDDRRSQAAANYAENVPDAFWLECILAIRDNKEVQDEKDKVDWTFEPISQTDGKYGKLKITYTADNTEEIAGQNVPWRRGLSQVDCQHRLGKMGESKREVTFCIFPNVTRREEAIIFKVINDKQKKINTSLVDAIVLATDPSASVYLKWAFDLGIDPGSPFDRLVFTGGRNPEPPKRLVTLRTLGECMKLAIPPKISAEMNADLVYSFIRNFWNVVRDLWPVEFKDPKNYKLLTVPGVRGLARLSRDIFLDNVDAQDFTQERIRATFKKILALLIGVLGGLSVTQRAKQVTESYTRL